MNTHPKKVQKKYPYSSFISTPIFFLLIFSAALHPHQPRRLHHSLRGRATSSPPSAVRSSSQVPPVRRSKRRPFAAVNCQMRKWPVQLFKVQMYYSTLQIAVIFLLSIEYASSYSGYVDDYIAKSYFDRYDSLIDQEFNYFVANEIPPGLLKGLKDKFPIVTTQLVLHRNVTGEGSHRHLSSSIRFKLLHVLKPELIAHSCEIIIIERLPSGVFADPFELQHLVQRDVFTDAVVFGDKNLELPSFRSNRTVVEIHIASKMLSTHEDDLVINLVVPLHARYPPLGLGFSRVKFGQPDLFVCCNIEENVPNRSCLFIATKPVLDEKASSDIWEIPCGMKEHAGIVSVVTFAFAIITALLLISTSITYSISEGSNISRKL